MELDPLFTLRVRRESRIYQLMTGFSDAEYAERICSHPRVQIAKHGKSDKARSISRTGIAGFQWNRVKTRPYIVDAIAQYLVHDQQLPESPQFSLFRPSEIVRQLADAQRKFLGGRVLSISAVENLVGYYEATLISGKHAIFIQFNLEYKISWRALFIRGVLYTKLRGNKRSPFAKYELSFSRQRNPITSFIDGYAILTRYHLNLFFREEKSNEYFFLKIPLIELGFEFPGLSAAQSSSMQKNNVVVLPRAYIDPDIPPHGVLKYRSELVQVTETNWLNYGHIMNIFMRVPRKKDGLEFKKTPYEVLWYYRNFHMIIEDHFKYIEWLSVTDPAWGYWVDLRNDKLPFEEMPGTLLLIQW